MKRKTMKTNWLVVATLIFSVFIGNASADTIIVRGDINIDDGPKISFSAPVGLLQALKTSGISALVENKEELCRLIDSLMGELESIKDNHLLILKVKNEVEAHVWVEEANRDEPMRANFVFVDIAPGKHEPEVSLRLPQGIFFLGSFIGNQFVERHSKEVLEMFGGINVFPIPEIPEMFNCSNMEMRNVIAGSFEAYNITVGELGSIYYAPAVGNIIEISVGNYNIELKKHAINVKTSFV